MRKGLIVLLTVGLVVLLPATPAAAKHTKKKVNHLHFIRSARQSDDKVKINGRMYTGTKKRCKHATGVTVRSRPFSPSPSTVTTNNYWFKGRWKMVEGPGRYMVRVRCNGVLFKGKFRVREDDLAYTGVPVSLTAGVGLGLTTIGWLMLIAAGSGRAQPAGSDGQPARPGPVLRRLLIPRGARRRSGGRAQGSDTAAIRRR